MISLPALNDSGKENNYVVYMFYVPGCDLPFYVGKGRPERPYSHLAPCNLKKTTRFYNKLNSLISQGIDPKVDIIAKSLSNKQANEFEISLIKIYGRLDLGTGCLTNHTPGGETGPDWQAGHEQTIDTRIKMSKPRCPRSKASQKEKLRKIRGHKIESFNLQTGVTVKQYPSISSVAEDGYSQGNISMYLAGVRKQAYGYGWRYTT